jgi:hypothetical protein
MRALAPGVCLPTTPPQISSLSAASLAPEECSPGHSSGYSERALCWPGVSFTTALPQPLGLQMPETPDGCAHALPPGAGPRGAAHPDAPPRRPRANIPPSDNRILSRRCLCLSFATVGIITSDTRVAKPWRLDDAYRPTQRRDRPSAYEFSAFGGKVSF